MKQLGFFNYNYYEMTLTANQKWDDWEKKKIKWNKSFNDDISNFNYLFLNLKIIIFLYLIFFILIKFNIFQMREKNKINGNQKIKKISKILI